jgi:hypothetical protein
VNGYAKEAIKPDLRWLVWERDDFACHYCGSRRHLSIDHKIPESKGGMTEAENLLTACKRCNSEKGTLDYEEFLFRIESRLAIQDFVAIHGNLPGENDEDGIRIYKCAKLGVFARLDPNVVDYRAPHPRTGMSIRYFLILPSMTREQFDTVIADRRKRKQFAEADRFAALARERFED